MTKLGEYLISKSVNKSEVARKTGLSKPRLSELTLNHSAKLRADELYLIALAIDVNPGDLIVALYSDLKLKR
ncbi:helix-turn-helix transcriptional regulator [Terrimonas sp. NA20]|uniref:Helix-turn-helix transcriptional regulator n=1 Tax=Terrimonas ginsenosidimutans TaxID=2908004 RepID=A0ABS9KKC7_9BACT|nr:helix-turn-helix transcriptional regulator [Terrimonas ginsenosidimutans]MCG2612774.1 helix-turn-helix transcriptional regulator [Terrimonas ginsenosidimutans]